VDREGGIPDAEVRAALDSMAPVVAPYYAAVACLFEGEGFRAAMIRGVISSFQLLSRAKYPQKVFSNPTSAPPGWRRRPPKRACGSGAPTSWRRPSRSCAARPSAAASSRPDARHQLSTVSSTRSRLASNTFCARAGVPSAWLMVMAPSVKLMSR
jgi:hypothetical protein